MEAAVLNILADYGYKEDIDDPVNVEEAGSETKIDQTYFEEKLLNLRKVELVAEARKHHLPASGNKRDLVGILFTPPIYWRSYCESPII